LCRYATALDGEHRSLLISWARTGQWLSGAVARRRLNMKLLRRGMLMAALVAEHSMVPSNAMTPQQAEPQASSSSDGDDGGDGGGDGGGGGGLFGGGRRGRRKKNKGGGGGKRRGRGDGGVDATTDGTAGAAVAPDDLKRAGPPPPVPDGDGVLVALAIRGGRIGARLWLVEDTLLPHRLELATPEGVEVWVFARWTANAATGLVLPGTSHQTHPAGNSCVFDMSAAEVVKFGEGEATAERAEAEAAGGTEGTSLTSVFAQPYEGYPPSSDGRWAPPVYDAAGAGTGEGEGAAAAAAAAAAITEAIAARGEGGHVLVLPRLGHGGATATPGWFVLDTSCSGYAVVGLYKLNSVWPIACESAWFHPLKLKSEKLVSSLCFQNATCTATPWTRRRRTRAACPRSASCRWWACRRVGLCVALHDAHWSALYV
jgi:hypothetical protein